jgi:hypothetical protein
MPDIFDEIDAPPEAKPTVDVFDQLEAHPDSFEGQLTAQGLTVRDFDSMMAEGEKESETLFPKKPARGLLGGIAHGVARSFESTAKGPGVFTLSNDTLKNELQEKYSELTQQEEPGVAGKAGEFVGELGGVIAQAVPIGIAAKKPGIAAMFGSSGAYNAFVRAGTRAIAEGKSMDDAVSIGKKAAIVGGTAQAAVAAALPSKGAATLGEALMSGLKPAAAGAGAVAAENITERALGLSTPLTEGVGPAAATMGLLPAGGHLVSRAVARLMPRSLEAFKQTAPPEPTAPAEIPYRVPSSLETGVLQPAGAATVVVDPTGRAVMMRELSPLEQTEAMRGPRVFTPREQQVRPAQAAPAVIGESQAARLARQEPEIIQQPEIVPATQAATAPSMAQAGGEVSFGAAAKAQAIPSARQAALPGTVEAGFSAGKEPSAGATPSAQGPASLPAPSPSSQALGIMPPGARLLGQIIDAFTPKAKATLPRTPSTAGDFLPELGDRAANKAIANEPTGIGRIPVLNWLFDPRHRAKTEPEKAIITHFYEQAVGQAHVKALGSTFGTRFKQLFPRNEAGELSTVGRITEGQSLHPSDVFEGLQRNPNAYRLTPEQRQAFDELMRYEKRARELEQKHNIRENPETGEVAQGGRGDDPYYTRGRVIGQPQRPGGMGGGSVGGKQFFQKARKFESEAQGVSKGFSYPMNVDDRILVRLSRLYKAIVDKRLADDEGLGGRWGSDSGPVTYQEGQVFQPAFRSGAEYKIFPVEVAQKINSTLGAQQTEWLKALQNGNDFFKALTLGFDFGAGQIQGLVTAFRDPKAWANANAAAIRAFGNKDAFAAYMRNNAQAARELAQFGSGVGSIPEMVGGLAEGGIVSAIPRAIGRSFTESGLPGVGRAVARAEEVPQAFGRLFQTFLDVAKIEKWKARREVTPREEWPRAIQEIEHELNAGRMEAIGVGPGQALAERLLLLAPSYYRGGIGLIGDMAAQGVTGAQARRAMGSYMAGILATFAAGATAAGMPWEEIKRRLNPSSGNFLMVPLKMGGKSIEVGFGGIMRSFMRLGGEVTETSIKHPENWKSLSSDKNPFTKWLRGHSAPLVSKAWDQFSGKDYAGEDADMTSLGRGSLPLALQSWLKQEKGQTGGQTAADVTFSFLGLLSWPQNTRNRMLVERNRLAQEQFKAPYQDLKIRDQAAVTRALERNPEFALKETSTPRQIEQAFRYQVQRQADVTAGLDKSIRDVLEEKGLHVSGFEPSIKIGPTQIYLTEAQMDRYKTLIIEEYNRVLKGRAGILRKTSPTRGQDLINDWLVQAKQRARTKLQSEFNR